MFINQIVKPFGALIALSSLQLYSYAAPITPPHQIALGENPIANAEEIRAALKQAAVIPDVLSDFLPTHSLALSYSSTTVNLGNKISPSQASQAPTYAIRLLTPPSTLSPTRTVPSNTTYTLVLSDPDATSHADPTKGEMCHWILTGIKLVSVNATSAIDTDGYEMPLSFEMEGSDGMEQRNILTGLMEYMPPGPPPKTGYHRYVFVLLAPIEGEGGSNELVKPKERAHWGYGKMGKGVRNWAKDNGLEAVGANFFFAQNEKQ